MEDPPPSHQVHFDTCSQPDSLWVGDPNYGSPTHGLLTIKYLMARAKKQDGVQLEYRDSYRDKITSLKQEEKKAK